MLGVSVSLENRSGGHGWAPQYAYPGRGLHPIYGQWGSSGPAPRTPLGPALPVSCRPRNRVGLSRFAWLHPRHQLQWHVHRSARSVVGRRWVFRAIESGPAFEDRLHGETYRTRQGNGRGCFPLRIGKSEALSGFAIVTHTRGPLMPPYTRAVPRGAGAARGKE